MSENWPLKYKNDPIVEAIISLRFSSRFTVEDKLRAIQDEIERQFHVSGHDYWWFEVTPDFGTEELQAAAVPHFGWRVLCSRDGHWRVTIGKDFVALHVIKPYPGWDLFREQAEKILNSCLHHFEPHAIDELSLRYIDEIAILPQQPPTKYFQIVPRAPLADGFATQSFDVELRQKHGQTGVRSLLRFGPRNERRAGWPLYVYDLAVIQPSSPQQPLTTDNWASSLPELRLAQRAIFESSITDELRQVLGGES